jgi:beta-glucanase (GH16 family)
MQMMWMVAAQVAGLGANNYAVDRAMAPPRVAPAFADEFKSAASLTNWRFDTARNAAGWYNNEKQYYSAARLANARVRGGRLVIEARRERLARDKFSDWGGQSYTSARMISRQGFQHGYYEIRAKLPCGRGIWPAIWMLPASGNWPEMGEIDIMEMVGWDPNVIHGTVHTGAFNHAKGTQRGAQTRVATSCTAFHRYQLDWRPDALTIGVDDRAFFEVRNDQPGGAAAWPFNKPFHMILNVAVGGDWGGKQGIDDAAFPQQMTIDYVRHWPMTGRPSSPVQRR